MNYLEFLDQVIKQGIEGAKRDYKDAKRQGILRGSVAGFKACKGLDPMQLELLLKSSKEDMEQFDFMEAKSSKKKLDDYWYQRGYILEVEWVCNVVSALLVNEGRSPIITPTAGGTVRAAKILELIPDYKKKGKKK